MRKAISLGLIVLFFASVFVGCKKGENDPMSLLSRKARITGEWELTEADYKETDEDGTYNYDFGGSSMVVTSPDGSYTATYSEKATIVKDGTFESEEEWIYPDGGGTFKRESEGLWYFLEGSKELDVKNSERVEFLILKETRTYTYDGDTQTYFDEYEGGSNSQIQIFLLDRLAKKEMVSLFDYEERDEDGDFFKMEGTKTYEKQ